MRFRPRPSLSRWQRLRSRRAPPWCRRGRRRKPPQGAGTAEQQQAGTLLILPTSELIGRPLKDPQGHDAGQVRAIVLDTGNGAIDFVVIGSNGNFDVNGGVIAVPWSTLEPPTSAQGALKGKAGAEKLRQAPRLDRSEAADLREPRSRANIYAYYGYPNPGPLGARDGCTEPAQAGSLRRRRS